MEIKRFLSAVVRKIWVVILLLALCGGGMFYFEYSNSYDLYEATTTVFTVTTGDASANTVNPGKRISYDDIIIARQFEPDLFDIMQSEKVINDAANSLKDRDVSAEEILGAISLSSQKESNIIKITATAEDAERAALIANAVSKAFVNRINDITKTNIFGILTEAKKPDNPMPSDLVKRTVMGLLTGLVLALVIIYITELFDTRIRSIDDIEYNANLRVLARIPKYTVK